MNELTELRLAGKTLYLGDYVEVLYRSGGGIRGNITKFWSEEHGDRCSQAQVNNGWCFHDWDSIREHRRNEIKKYQITNRITNETKEVVANSAQKKLGWMIGYCFVQEVQC